MNQLTKTLFFSILFIGLKSYSQLEPFYKTYDWEEKPKYEINVSDSTEKVTMKDKLVKEFIFTEDNNLTEYSLSHQVIWLNSDQEIENNNKVYLPYSASSELIVNKARVITKEGKVINLDESKIKNAEDEEGRQMYKYFTFEGLEKGSYIEYISVYRKYPRYKGVKVYLQNSNLKYNIEFDLYAPKNLYFEFKSYNGLSSVVKDTLEEEKNHWNIIEDTLQALENESQASYNVHRKHLIYKLDRNLNTGIYDISSYGKSSENMYKFLYDNISKSDAKAIKKLIKYTGALSVKDKSKKIRMVEDYIKKNISQSKKSGDQLINISNIIKNKIANEGGLLRLYAQIYKQLDIKAQLVITCNRSNAKFDKEFESGNYLTDYMLYFPSSKSFLSPSEINSRVGFPPPYLTNNYGLFIKEVSLGDFNTGIGKIKFITPTDYRKNYNDIIVDVVFDADDISKTILSIDHSYGGYYSMNTQTLFHLLDEEAKKKIIDAQIKFMSDDIKVTEQTVHNDNAESFGFEPLRVEAKAETNVFIEKAGPKYLFKIGELIGPQMEMYQEKERVLPLETEYSRIYHRTLTFTIPEGYKINNLSDLNISNETKNNDGEIIFKFNSEFKLEGNKVIITGIEFYSLIEISPELYEEYRKVINSAADFNKVTLILESN